MLIYIYHDYKRLELVYNKNSILQMIKKKKKKGGEGGMKKKEEGLKEGEKD